MRSENGTGAPATEADVVRFFSGLTDPQERSTVLARVKMKAAQEAPEEAFATPGLLSRRVDLGTLLRDGIPPVEYLPGDLARRMVYRVGVTGFSGHPESGKTTLVCRLALDAMRHGRHVAYFDYENGETETARRFLALGATADLLSERLLYLPFPGAPDWDQIGTLWDEFPDAVAVWDSLRGILRTLGINEDKASEVATFMDPLKEFTTRRETASMVIDHVTKAATSDSRYARGSGDKLAAVDAQWFVDRKRPFSEVESGEIEVVRSKARSGALLRSHRFEVGDGAGNLTFRRLDPDETPEGRMDAAIIETLKATHPESCSQNDVEAAVEGHRKADVRDRLKALADDPQRPVAALPSGRFTRYAYNPDADHEPAQPLAF